MPPHAGARSGVPLLLVFLLAAPAPRAADSAAPSLPEYALKAEFIERFTRFIEWPAGSPASDQSAPFVIGLFGRSPLRPHLERLADSRRIKGRPVVVEEVGRLDEIDACHVLFIPRSQAPSLAKIVSRTARLPVLTVGDTDGFAETGVILNFFVEEDRLRFEINERAAHSSGLKIGAPLFQLARVIRPEAR